MRPHGPTTDRTILLATPDFPPSPGGIANLFSGLAENAAGTWRVVALGPAQAATSRRVFGVRAPGLSGRLRRLWRTIRLNALAMFGLLAHRPDVFIAGHISLGPTSVACRLLAVPVVAVVHADEVAWKPRLARLSLKAAVRVVAVSEYAASLARGVGVNPTRIRIIHPGLSVEEYRARDHPRAFRVLVVARLAETYKGHDVLLTAIAALRTRFPGLLLAVVGDGPLRPTLEAQVATLQIADHVTFLGHVSPAVLEAQYQAADIFVMPSRRPAHGGGEGFGIVYLEAAARGLPAVAGNETGTVDAVLDGKTGLLVDPKSVADVGQAIERLFTDAALYRRLSHGATAWAQQHDWPIVAALWDQLIADLGRR